jgi:hypothetical protein
MRSIKLFTLFAIFAVLTIGLFSHAVTAQSAQPAEAFDFKGEAPKAKEKSNKVKGVLGGEILELITATTYPMTLPGAVLEDMSTGTTQLIGASSDDGNSAVANIGFDFWFDGVRASQFGANANGFMRVGGVTSGSSFGNDLDSTTNAPKIAPYWDDLCTGTNGKVHFKTIGSAPNRKLIVEWQNMQITRGAGCAGAGTGTFQVWLFESEGTANQGAIQFVYGALPAPNFGVDGGYSTGLQSGGATNFAAVTTTSNTVSYVAANDVQANAIPAGTSYLFTSNVPAAPTGLTFSPVTPTTIQLNWTDNAINEFGYVIYRSTDGTNFSFLAQTAAGATTFTDTSLSPSTTYFYRVYAVTEGALSTFVAGSQITAAPGASSCVVPGGLWSAPATWGGTVPTAGDAVTIPTGCTVTIDTAAVAFSIFINTGGVLQYEATTARSLSVGSDVILSAGAVFQSAATGTQTGHTLNVAGNLTTDGTLDFSTNADTAGATIVFSAGATNKLFQGGGPTTDVRAITVAKGAQATIVELTTTNFTVRGVNTDVAGYLTLTSGTFKISGTFTMANRTFPTATYTTPLASGFWLNNPNYTVVGQAGGTTSAINGLLRLTTGTFNIGVTAADGLAGATGATYIIEGGTMNATGRFSPQGSVTYTQTGGTINVGTLGNTVSNFGSFELFGSTSVSNFNGGTINLINAATVGTLVDFRVNGALIGGAQSNATPTVLNVGTAATATNFNFRISGHTPSIVIDNTANNKTATFIAQTQVHGNVTVNPGTTYAINGTFNIIHADPGFIRTFTNNGTITGNLAGSRFYFLGVSAGSGNIYTGSGIAGTVAAPLLSLDFDSFAGVDLSGAANNIITSRVIMFTGNVTGSGKITLGVGGVSTGVVQIGNTTTPTNAGVFDTPFTFNLGTGGQTNSYLRTTTSYTTGGEINPARTLTSMTVDNNVTSLNIAGGNITITGAMTLTNGTVFTGNGNTIIHNGAAARTNGFVDGNLGRDFAAPGAYTFFVGQTAHTPVLATVTAVTAAGRLTARSFDGTLAGFNPPTSLSRNWSLEETGDLTADLSFTYGSDAIDVNGNEADYRVYRREANLVTTNMCSGGPCVNVGTNTLGPIVGVTAFSRWTGAENQVPVAANASISGRVLTSNGNGIRNAVVSLSGGTLTQPVIVQTGPFGSYSFDNLQVGQTYFMQVSAKRFRFSSPSRIITLQDNLEDLNFIANPQD